MKRLFAALMSIGVILSLVTGYLVFLKTEGKLYSPYTEIENADWLIPLNSGYSNIEKISEDDENSWYIATSSDFTSTDVTYEILDENFQKQGTYTSLELMTDGLGYISTYVSDRTETEGLMDSKGNEILAPIYAYVSAPKDGYIAAVYLRSAPKASVVFFSENGKRLFSEEKINVTSSTSIINAGNGVFAILAGDENAQTTIYDAKTKSVTKTLDNILMISDLGNGNFAAEPRQSHSAVTIYDSSFNYVTTLPENLMAPQAFSEGKAIAPKSYYSDDEAGYVCLDENFNPLFDIYATHDAISFSEGKAICYNDDSVFCIDSSGETIYRRELRKSFGTISPFFVCDSFYKNGKTVLCDGKLFGIADENGNWVIKPHFTILKYASENTYIAATDSLTTGVLRIKN